MQISGQVNCNFAPRTTARHLIYRGGQQGRAGLVFGRSAGFPNTTGVLNTTCSGSLTLVFHRWNPRRYWLSAILEHHEHHEHRIFKGQWFAPVPGMVGSHQRMESMGSAQFSLMFKAPAEARGPWEVGLVRVIRAALFG
jgi:hypothetical protein